MRHFTQTLFVASAIQRREANKQGVFGDWHRAGVALETEPQMTGEPRGDQLEYRVSAINAGGQSAPSNTVMAVL